MSQAAGLDHIGIVGRDLNAMAAAFGAAGFHLTPLARHAGGRTGNRCAMFPDGGYLELMATVDGGTSATIDRFLASHEGAHLLAFGIDNPTATRARLRHAWGDKPPMSHTDRAVDDADPTGLRARFTLIGPFDRPEARVNLIHHETPDALWQPRFLQHPNNAVALEEVVLTVPEPAIAAAWYSQLAGRPVVPDPAGGFALPLPCGRVRILPGAATASPRIAAIAIRTKDSADAAPRLIPGAQVDNAITEATIGGTTIRFV